MVLDDLVMSSGRVSTRRGGPVAEVEKKHEDKEKMARAVGC
jgi:hypothetical protein